jgi:hypothetical protein
MEQENLSKNARQEPKPKADGYRFYMLKRLKSPHRTTPNPTIFWPESPRHVENSHKKNNPFFHARNTMDSFQETMVSLNIKISTEPQNARSKPETAHV